MSTSTLIRRTVVHEFHLASLAVAAAIALSAAPPAGAQPRPGAVASPDELKTAYLACEDLAARSMLDGTTTRQCSVVYETLKAQVFGGDYGALLSWWTAARRSATAAGAGESTARGGRS